mgnify:CR=1 FL=1
MTVTPDSDGDYRVTLRSKDSKGKDIARSVWVWVMDEDEIAFH